MKKSKIIIIEDDESLVKLISDILRDNGFDISLIAPDDKLMQKIDKAHPDLILLDIILSNQSGFDVLEELKNNVSTKNIPIIILSNLGSAEEIRKGLQFGAVDYIVKTNHSMQEVVNRIKKVIKNKK